jgi:hypothetical protein
VWEGLLFNLLVCGNGDETLAGEGERLPGTAEQRPPRAAEKGHGYVLSRMKMQGRCGDGRDRLGSMSIMRAQQFFQRTASGHVQENLGPNKGRQG